MDARKLERTILALACCLGASATGAATSFQWGNVTIGGGGFVSGVIPSSLEQNLFYVRTDVGGAYRWDDGLKKWIPLTDWMDVNERGLLGVEALAVDPKTPGTVYMMTGTIYWNQAKDGIGRSAFLRSKDYGKTWEKFYTWDDNTKKFNVHGNGMGRGNGERLAIDPNNTDVMFYGSRNKGLFKSVDNGTSWAHVDGFTAAAGFDTTWNGCGFSFVTFAPGSSTTLYAGFLRPGANVFQSLDGGVTWKVIPIPTRLVSTAGGAVVRLMPQHMVLSPDGKNFFATFADGAGPSPMVWDEGWGMIADGFGRGTVLKYSLDSAMWSNVSPENNIDGGATGPSQYDSLNVLAKTYQYIAPYSGISMNPSNPLEMVVSTMGYTGPQFWYDDSTKKWKDEWGTNIYYTVDGGLTWIKSFQYYWIDGGTFPTARQMDANGIGWMRNSSIHWSGSVAMDPFNHKRVFVTSGNGVFRTDDITDFTLTPPPNSWTGASLAQRQVWKVSSQGIEEVVPLEVVSIPGGPLVSVIGDYDGFRHDDISQYPATRHLTNVGGSWVSLGSTQALAFAPKSGRLVKVSDARSANPTTYTDVPLSPLQFSSDSGRTWTVATYESIDTGFTGGASVAISTDGAATLWTPWNQHGKWGNWPVQRYANAAWTVVTGIDGASVVGDPVDATIFYAYTRADGSFYKSADKGATFTKVGTAGVSDHRKFRLAPGRSGDIWVPVSRSGAAGGLWHSIDGGATFAPIAGVDSCQAVGFGMAAPGKNYPAIYVFATIGAVTGIFQSIDSAATWTRVDDDDHQYGGIANGEFLMGDMNTFGTVYLGTAGRGIAARFPSTTNASIKGRGAGKVSNLGTAQLNGDLLLLQVAGQPLSLQIHALDGRLVRRTEFARSTIVRLSNLVPQHGLYLLEVHSGNTSVLTSKVSRLR